MNDFNIIDNHIIYVCTGLILFFIIPIIWVGKKKEVLKSSSLNNFASVLNLSFYYQVIGCTCGLIISLILQESFYISQSGLDLVFVEVIYCITLILILYLPAIVIMNFIKFIKQQNI